MTFNTTVRDSLDDYQQFSNVDNTAVDLRPGDRIQDPTVQLNFAAANTQSVTVPLIDCINATLVARLHQPVSCTATPSYTVEDWCRLHEFL